MAAPPGVTTKAMSGRFLMNKSLSDNTDDILCLQGVSWLKRRAISMFPLFLSITHTVDEAGIEHIDVEQTLSGGIPAEGENRILDWHARDSCNNVFGLVTEQSRRIPVQEVTDEFLRQGWTPDTIENGIVLADSWSTPGKNNYTWKALQTWGFATIKGERRYVRLTTFTSPKKQDGPIYTRFVYDYLGKI